MTTRDLPSTYTDALQAATTYPLYLIEFDTGAGFARITNNHKKIVFPDGGDTFYPRPLESRKSRSIWKVGREERSRSRWASSTAKGRTSTR